MHGKLLECCDKRGDTWASEVQNRLCGCLDLVAAEAIYHANCYSQFMLDKARRGLFPFVDVRPESDSVKHNLRLCTTSSDSLNFLAKFS